MTISEFERLPESEKKKLFFNCCGSHDWVKLMVATTPVNDLGELLEHAEENWYECNTADWLEAFKYQENIGNTNAISREGLPQIAKVKEEIPDPSTGETLKALENAHHRYEDTFGYIFISYAPGKSAEVLLTELEERLHNDPREEIMIAAAEQDKIIKHRLRKLFS